MRRLACEVALSLIVLSTILPGCTLVGGKTRQVNSPRLKSIEFCLTGTKTACAEIDPETRQLRAVGMLLPRRNKAGYLESTITQREAHSVSRILAGNKALDFRPKKAWLPHGGFAYGSSAIVLRTDKGEAGFLLPSAQTYSRLPKNAQLQYQKLSAVAHRVMELTNHYATPRNAVVISDPDTSDRIRRMKREIDRVWALSLPHVPEAAVPPEEGEAHQGYK